MRNNVEEVECYEAVIKLNPTDVKAHYNMGVALRESADYPRSLSAF